MKKQYRAREGSPFSNKEAQIVGETLNNLRDRKGELTTERIVETARNETSPLHKYFEWSDNTASELYRLQQARHIINHVVEIVVVGTEQVKQRSFFSIETSNRKTAYVTIKQAIETESYRKQLLGRAIVQLENLTITLRMFKDVE